MRVRGFGERVEERESTGRKKYVQKGGSESAKGEESSKQMNYIGRKKRQKGEMVGG